MNSVALIAAGSVALLGAAIHGIGGELLVLRKLSPEALPSSRFGDSKMTKTMIHAAWHLTTVAFVAVGSALVLAGAVLDGDAARALGFLAASAATGFAGVVVWLAITQARRGLLHHPGPAVLTASALLAWWGVL